MHPRTHLKRFKVLRFCEYHVTTRQALLHKVFAVSTFQSMRKCQGTTLPDSDKEYLHTACTSLSLQSLQPPETIFQKQVRTTFVIWPQTSAQLARVPRFRGPIHETRADLLQQVCRCHELLIPEQYLQRLHQSTGSQMPWPIKCCLFGLG